MRYHLLVIHETGEEVLTFRSFSELQQTVVEHLSANAKHPVELYVFYGRQILLRTTRTLSVEGYDPHDPGFRP